MMDVVNMLNPTEVLLAVCVCLLLGLLIALGLVLRVVRQIRRTLEPGSGFPVTIDAQLPEQTYVK